MPIVNTSLSSFIEPEFTGYTTSDPLVVVNVGSDIELNFSSPVKIILGGMVNKRAAWSKNSTTLTSISTLCDSTHSNIDAITTRECYINDSNNLDLNIWTYHFTNFVAYTLTAVESTTTSTGSGNLAQTLSFWILTYVIGESDFKNGVTRELKTKERMKVIVDKKDYFVGIISMTSDSAVINVSSIPQQSILNIGEEKKFDVDNDSYYDIDVILKSILNDKANVTIKSIYEKFTPVSNTVQNNTLIENVSENSNVENTESSNYWSFVALAFFIFVIIIAIIFVVFIILKRNSRKRDKYIIFKR
jgi:hypothetical protein